MHVNPFLSDLAIVLAVAAVTSLAARLVRQPTILGYLLAGLIVGPYIPIPIFVDPERVHTMAEFGVILVMFAIGLEFRLARLIRVLPTAGLTGLVQMTALFWAGYAVGDLVGWGNIPSLFLGAGIAISSTMVVSKVFEQIPPTPDVRELVLGVLVVQDVVAILLIAVMTGIARGGGLSGAELASTLSGLGALLGAFVIGGMLIVPRLIRVVVRMAQPEILVVVSVGLCFAMALVAAALGYSVALGAFIAGVLVAESGEGAEVEHRIQSMRDIFAAVFFVSIGMSVNPGSALDNLPLALLLFVVIVVMQFLSITIAGVLTGNNVRRAIKASLALGQIGEFGFILAGIATANGVVGPELQSVLVTVAILTAFTTPIAVRLGQRVALAIDHLTPTRVQQLLSLYESWLQRLRTRKDGRRAQIVRAIRVLALDAAGILVILAVTITWLPVLAQWLAVTISLDERLAGWAVGAIALLLCAPLLVGLIRNAVVLSRLVADSVLPEGREPVAAERGAAHVLGAMIYLAVLAGVGFPTVAVLQPVTGELYGAVLLGVAFVVTGVYLWRSAGAFETELASGAERVASALARQAAGGEAYQVESEAPVLPGLAGTTAMQVTAGGPAAGRSLAELGLRKSTGANVIAIQRAAGTVVLPRGDERLEVGDLLAVAGSSESVALARLTIEGDRS